MKNLLKKIIASLMVFAMSAAVSYMSVSAEGTTPTTQAFEGAGNGSTDVGIVMDAQPTYIITLPSEIKLKQTTSFQFASEPIRFQLLDETVVKNNIFLNVNNKHSQQKALYHYIDEQTTEPDDTILFELGIAGIGVKEENIGKAVDNIVIEKRYFTQKTDPNQDYYDTVELNFVFKLNKLPQKVGLYQSRQTVPEENEQGETVQVTKRCPYYATLNITLN